VETTLLEAFAGTAGTEVVPAQLFFQQFVAVDHPLSLFDMGFGWESPTPLAHRLEKNGSSSKFSYRMAHLLLI
jgi:hypothetical protein